MSSEPCSNTSTLIQKQPSIHAVLPAGYSCIFALPHATDVNSQHCNEDDCLPSTPLGGQTASCRAWVVYLSAGARQSLQHDRYSQSYAQRIAVAVDIIFAGMLIFDRLSIYEEY